MNNNTRAGLVGNVLGNQAVWLCAVAGAGRGLAWPAVVAALLYCGWQLRVSATRAIDLRLLAVALVLGCAVDGGLAAAGWLDYAAPWPATDFAPAWILALWAAFAMLPMHALAWLRHRPLAAFAFGAIGGPLAYLAAARGFDAVAVTGPVAATWTVLSLAWGAAFAALMVVAWRASAPVPQPVAGEGVPT